MKAEHHERRQCPEEFQERLTRMFGVSQFGDPHFIIVWGQSQFIRMGNVWRDRFGNERRGFRDVYQCHGTPCWNIMRWKQPSHYGSPESYYTKTWDDFSKLHFLGEYPWRGRYEIAQPLMWQEYIGGKIITEMIPCIMPNGKIQEIPRQRKVGEKLVVHHMALSHVLIDKIIPMLVKIQQLSKQELRAIHEANKAAQHKKEVAEMAEVMAENLPSYFGPVSYSRQGCRTSLLDRKMAQIEQAWKKELRTSNRKSHLAKGFQIANQPLRVAR